ncbi:eukaryotic translation initiation factor, partial [Thalassiosira pseudonana CCMP1335]
RGGGGAGSGGNRGQDRRQSRGGSQRGGGDDWNRGIEKQVKGILNKMTKEKFDKLSDQMCDIPILSYNMLSMFIKLVYEKAIGEPYLSDMYANLCYRLAARIECQNDATKMNTFKRSLLNKCEDEFNKQDIYNGWKEEKKAYDKIKATLTEPERVSKEEDLEFRRMKIKKQMLGNVKFIGELYKLGMLKEKIMRFCIQSLMKLEEDDDMDEEDHEALCNLFITIGKTIDNPKAQPYMQNYFQKISALSDDTKNLSSRSRFMYKDLIEMRANGWQTRRKLETAKTLDEIRKDAEREERAEAQRAAQQNSGGSYRGGGRGGGYDSRDSRGPPRGGDVRNERNDSQRGIGGGGGGGGEVFTKEKLELRAKNMRNEFKEGHDEKELLMSMDEVLGSPDAGKTVVQVNVEYAIDCKAPERQALIEMIVILFKNGKLSKSDVQVPMLDMVEFIDSFVVDSPGAFGYLGEMLSAFLDVKTLDIAWLCDATSKVMNKSDQVKVIDHAMKVMTANYGEGATRACFGGPGESVALSQLLGQAEFEKLVSEYL